MSHPSPCPPPPTYLLPRDLSDPSTNQPKPSLDPFALPSWSALPRAHDPRRGDPPRSPVAPSLLSIPNLCHPMPEGARPLVPDLPHLLRPASSSNRTMAVTPLLRDQPPLICIHAASRRRPQARSPSSSFPSYRTPQPFYLVGPLAQTSATRPCPASFLPVPLSRNLSSLSPHSLCSSSSGTSSTRPEA